MIKIILWDIDGTLLDFAAAEAAAVRACFARFGLGACTNDMLARYSALNQKYWQRLERGEITKAEVLLGRFQEFFTAEGLPAERAADFNAEYQLRLGDTIVFRDRADELVPQLKAAGYRQYAVTNGTLAAQSRKLARSGLGALLDGVFISEQLGYEKPARGFFDAVFSQLGPREAGETLIVGDSLTSDMRGGNNAGILCCWYNPDRLPRPADLRIDYEIASLQKLRGLLL